MQARFYGYLALNMMQRFSFRMWVIFGTVAAFSLMVYALVSEHAFGYVPCVRCIEQRMTMLVMFFCGLLALSHARMQLPALLGVVAAAAYGVWQAHTHAGVIAGTVIDQCAFRPALFYTIPLDDWLPWLFQATGDCSEARWQVAGMNMPEWLRIIFAVFCMAALALLAVRLRARFAANNHA